MDVVSIVANVVKERDFLREAFADCRNIIKQLSEGPGDVIYIHPLDVCAVLADTHDAELIKFVKSQGNVFSMNGKKYKQSALIPAKTNNFR